MGVLSLESHETVCGATHLLHLLEFELVPRICRDVGLALSPIIIIIGHLKLRVFTETVIVFVK